MFRPLHRVIIRRTALVVVVGLHTNYQFVSPKEREQYTQILSEI
jgi:hypothetical protein